MKNGSGAVTVLFSVAGTPISAGAGASGADCVLGSLEEELPL